jgi:hypothetical protein
MPKRDLNPPTEIRGNRAIVQDFNQKMAVHIAQGIENIVRIAARQKRPHEQEVFLYAFIVRPLSSLMSF